MANIPRIAFDLIAESLRTAIRGEVDFETQEHSIIVILDTHLNVVETRLIGKGTVNCVSTHPRDVYREAIRLNAYAVALTHNHPSGSMIPSPQDEELTMRLMAIGEVIGVVFLGHLLVTAADSAWIRVEQKLEIPEKMKAPEQPESEVAKGKQGETDPGEVRHFIDPKDYMKTLLQKLENKNG